MRIGVIVALALVAGCKGAREGTADTGERTKALPESCAAYRRALDTLPACSGVSKDELASLWRGYQDASTAWVNRDLARMPANTLRAIDVACTAGRDFIRGRIAEMCPERAERAEADFGGASKLPAECSEYRDTIFKLATCDKLPQQSRDALLEGFRAMEKGWADMDVIPAEARKALAEACKQGTDALKQAASATCGW